MTYFELIKNLKILEKEKRNEEAYNKFMNSDITLYTNMNYRLGMHLIRFLNKKVSKVYNDFTEVLINSKFGEDEFTTQVIDLKNELKYIKTFTNIKFLKKECNDDLVKIYNNLTNDYNKTISSSIENVLGENYIDIYNEIIQREEGKE